MKIYDITKPFFETNIYPGDPIVECTSWYTLNSNAPCNLHAISFGTHTSTHIDAPFHFLSDGVTVDNIPLEKCIGMCEVITIDKKLDMETLKAINLRGRKRILVKGKYSLTPSGAKYLAENDVLLFGTELNTVGDKEDGALIHQILLSKNVVILENIDLTLISDGSYFLLAQPLKLEGMDGSPVRAVLMEL